MRCDICGSTKTYIKDYNHTYIIKGKEIKFESKRRFCEECDNLVYDSKLDNEASLLGITLYNKKYGINKEDIINLRTRYNLSQDLFSKIIGCAKKTLISYEKGTSIPNDSYLNILKSFILKPETILTFLEANKEQFSEKEYDKINSKLNILKNDVENNELNEFNGYTKPSKEKIYNMILFFSDKVIQKTKLLKEMFYADFINYKSTCKSITGLQYSKLKFGPVPNQFETLLNQCSNEKVINYDVVYENEIEQYNISPIKKFDSSFFTKEELEIMKKVREKFFLYTSKEIANFSHKEKAYIETKYLDKISYEYAFDIESIK